ncbi:hypothetical protein [Candidatus Caldatribacterium sp.]|uniref:hypothetical protein n=1 Tax=Candidatus Caldatribacterium sp. TaxID=2282143 RepID=UPI00383CBBB8|nr:hypothetical protein [Candidatus Caldatribacterium sp.]
MRILWLSRHEPLPVQVEALKKAFGEDIEIVHDPERIQDADDVVSRKEQVGAEEVVIVAPLHIVASLLQRGIKPLRADMEAVDNPAIADTEASGRLYRFVGFSRLVNVVVETEKIVER